MPDAGAFFASAAPPDGPVSSVGGIGVVSNASRLKWLRRRNSQLAQHGPPFAVTYFAAPRATFGDGLVRNAKYAADAPAAFGARRGPFATFSNAADISAPLR